jgi:hypothetical protein
MISKIDLYIQREDAGRLHLSFGEFGGFKYFFKYFNILQQYMFVMLEDFGVPFSLFRRAFVWALGSFFEGSRALGEVRQGRNRRIQRGGREGGGDRRGMGPMGVAKIG